MTADLQTMQMQARLVGSAILRPSVFLRLLDLACLDPAFGPILRRLKDSDQDCQAEALANELALNGDGEALLAISGGRDLRIWFGDLQDDAFRETPESVQAVVQELRDRRRADRVQEDLRAVAACIAALPPHAGAADIGAAIATAEAAVRRAQGAFAPSVAEASLVSLVAEDMLAIRRPPREFILEPILRTKDLAMLVAKRGVGKTWVSDGMASAIAAGGEFLVWRAPKPRSVLYVDGELPFETVQERLELTRTMHGHDWGRRLRILAADYQECSIPSLNLPEGQRLVEEHLGEAEILFLDNLSALCAGGVENEAESWQPMQDWLLSLRRRGIAVLFDHHAGNSGNQRGTTKREDVLDLSIKLEHPNDYDSRDGARFIVTYTKARGIHGRAAEAFEARLGTGELSGSRWITKTCAAATKERVLNLHETGLSQADIAKELGKDKSTVSRIIKSARESGEIQ
jgi:putative DNA primase/helicase